MTTGGVRASRPTSPRRRRTAASPTGAASASESELRLSEAVLLLLLDEKNGDIEPVPPWALGCALTGAILMDLSVRNRVDTDVRHVVLVDGAPLDDEVLDPILAEIAAAGEKRTIRYWLEHFAGRTQELKEASLDALVARGLLAPYRDGGFLELVGRASGRGSNGSSPQPVVRLRVMQCLFGSDIPDPKDAMVISLADACGFFAKLLNEAEFDAVKPRLEVLRRIEHVGRAVARAIWEVEPPTRIPRRRSGKPIPVARGLPFIGNGIALARDSIGFLLRQYRIHGPVFRINAPGKHQIVMAGPEANLFVTRHGKDCLRGTDWWRNFALEFGADRTMLAMDGGDHFRFRRAQRDGMSAPMIDLRVDDAVRIARREAEGWTQPISALYGMQNIITEQLGTILAGASPREYLDDLLVVIRRLIMVKVGARPAFWLWSPRYRRSRKRVTDLAARIWTAHLERPDHLRPDLIDDLIDLHEADPQFFPEKDKSVAVLGPYIAGLDTVSAMCTFLLYALFTHPELMEAVTREADTCFEDGQLTASRLGELDVTPRVVLETLRRYPIGPGVMRRAVNSFEFEGHSIAPGDELLLSMVLPHFMEEYFPDPDRFDIDRYTADRAEHRQPAFAPFGVGTHRCLGEAFAVRQMMLTILTILHTVQLEMVPSSYRLRIVQHPTLRPCDRFRLRATSRRH